jgi:hypothetical protein
VAVRVVGAPGAQWGQAATTAAASLACHTSWNTVVGPITGHLGLPADRADDLGAAVRQVPVQVGRRIGRHLLDPHRRNDVGERRYRRPLDVAPPLGRHAPHPAPRPRAVTSAAAGIRQRCRRCWCEAGGTITT